MKKKKKKKKKKWERRSRVVGFGREGGFGSVRSFVETL